jgi:uncharacterized membrane protein
MPTLMVVGFKKDKFRASEVLNELVEMDYAWTIDLCDAVVAYRDYTGKLRIDASYQMTSNEDAALSGFFRSLIGLTLGAIATSSNGHGVMDANWWKDEFGISDKFVQDVGALVQPGDSAVFALVRATDPKFVAAKFSDYGGVVLSLTLNPEQANQVQAVVSGKNNFKPAGISPQTKKEKRMTTWTEMEKQIEPELRELAQVLDAMDAEDAAADAEFDAKMKAAKADAQAKLQAQAAKMHADSEARRTKLQRDMDALNDKLNAMAARLDEDTDKAMGKAKADLEAQQSKMRADREKLNAQIKASYQAEVNHIKSQIKQMQVLVETANAKYSAEIDAELDDLYQEAVEVDRQVANLHAEQVATWNANKAKVERAIADLKQARAKAMADLDEGYEKAKSEFKQAA